MDRDFAADPHVGDIVQVGTRRRMVIALHDQFEIVYMRTGGCGRRDGTDMNVLRGTWKRWAKKGQLVQESQANPEGDSNG